MEAESYRQTLRRLLDETSPGARFMVKVIMDEDGHCSSLDPGDHRQAMMFFRATLDLALEHGDQELAERVRRCRKRLTDPDVLMGGG